ncbi:hypothetical protein KEM55_006606 [Ascosphaera atra]|nr:hypothetical protein KEM55_006606 [Ascosphaera atra]
MASEERTDAPNNVNETQSAHQQHPGAGDIPEVIDIPSVAGRKRSASPVEAPVKKQAHASPVTKYYAVRVGRKPGIYYSWSDCRPQVAGHKGARYKSFTTLAEADAFMKGEQASSASDSKAVSSSTGEKFYGVRAGRKPGVYVNWQEARSQIAGFKDAKFRKFDSREAAENFVNHGHQYGLPDSEGLRPKPPRDEEGNVYPAGLGPMPEGAVDGFDPNVLLDPTTGDVVYKTPEQHSATKLQRRDDEGLLKIYTDGSTLGNGKLGAQAGYGVYFGPGDERRNVSEPLPGSRQTNQRAELTAILRALDIAPRSRDVKIFTDSKYAINCVTVWCQKWRTNNWQTSGNKPVENKDLITTIIDKIEERDSLEAKTLFEWVRGHNNDPGNEAADKLAVEGARRIVEKTQGSLQ